MSKLTTAAKQIDKLDCGFIIKRYLQSIESVVDIRPLQFCRNILGIQLGCNWRINLEQIVFFEETMYIRRVEDFDIVVLRLVGR